VKSVNEENNGYIAPSALNDDYIWARVINIYYTGHMTSCGKTFMKW